VSKRLCYLFFILIALVVLSGLSYVAYRHLYGHQYHNLETVSFRTHEGWAVKVSPGEGPVIINVADINSEKYCFNESKKPRESWNSANTNCSTEQTPKEFPWSILVDPYQIVNLEIRTEKEFRIDKGDYRDALCMGTCDDNQQYISIQPVNPGDKFDYSLSPSPEHTIWTVLTALVLFLVGAEIGRELIFELHDPAIDEQIMARNEQRRQEKADRRLLEKAKRKGLPLPNNTDYD